jgi:Cu-Zn family superoxide dismutase
MVMTTTTWRLAAAGVAVALAPAAGVLVSNAVRPAAAGHANVTAGATAGASDAQHAQHARHGSAGGRVSATLRLADGTRVGTVVLRPHGRHATQVHVVLKAPALIARRAFHGFHVHANDNPANGNGCVADPAQAASTWFVSADGHYTDPGVRHGDHRGDFPVLYVDASGRATASFVTDRFRPADVVGRAVIVHARADNYANVPTGTAPNQYTPNAPDAVTLTAATGNAGDRLACGLIRR